MRRLFFALFLLLALGQAQDLGALARAVFEAANAARVRYGVSPLDWDERLAEAARIHGEDLLRRHYFGHVHPRGPRFEERFWRAGVYALKVAENLYELDAPYLPADFARQAVEAWIQSPGHRKNLLDPRVTHMGVAVLAEGQRYLAVQEFAYFPFELRVAADWGEGAVERYVLEGQSPHPLAVVVAERRFLDFPPGRIRASFELPLGTRPRFLVRRRGVWFELDDAKRAKLGLSLRVGTVRRPGLWLRLEAPPGTYVLAYGEKTPRPFAEGALPARLFAPLTWRGVWIGRDGSFVYRIPLRP